MKIKGQKIKTKGQIEAEISNALTKFEIEYMGRGPKETKTYIIDDMVLVRLKGVLTDAEKQLTRNQEGRDLIKKVRATLLENAKDLLSKVIKDIVGVDVISLHTDISTSKGERVIIFILSECLD
ncbi:MAG: hypothetical protein A2W75_00070 [Nitrospinae bacterium RIFCSPLOWO2_12_39_15]|nr:MAG: hypothetical protein A2W53_08855 [Nitrospinae bacterium RIFCSPHIGHO2_02_39_11]OGW09860.1 MAG: hypothetical protein A2W75_00070 [Nitrospinae bacterium RIFCSPLOWO2_12_39_15]